MTEQSIGRISKVIARLGDSLIRQVSKTPATESSTSVKTWTTLTQLFAPGRRALGTLGGMVGVWVRLPWLWLTAIVLAPFAVGVPLVIWADGAWPDLGWTLVGFGVAVVALAIGVLWGAAWAIRKTRGIALGRLAKVLDELDPPAA